MSIPGRWRLWGLALVAWAAAAGGCQRKGPPQAQQSRPVASSSAPSASAAVTSPSAPVAQKCCEGLQPCIEALKDVENRDVGGRMGLEFCVQDALVELGDAAVDSLLSILTDQRPRVRERAARTIGRIDDPARKAVPALINMLAHDDPSVPAWALARIGDPRGVAPVLAQIDRIDATGVAESFGEQIVPGLVRMMVDPSAPMNRLRVVTDALEAVKTKPPGAAMPLVRALSELHSPKNRPTDGPDAGRELFDSRMTRLTAIVFALVTFGKGAAPAVPRLRELVHDPDALTRFYAREVITIVTGEDGPDAVRFRVDELTGTDWLDGKHGELAESEAARSLATILHGGKAGSATAGLMMGTEDDSTKIDAQLEAVRALGRLSAAEAVPPLIEALAFPDYRMNQAAAEALGRREPVASAAAPELERVARTHWSPAVAKAAAAALLAVAGKAVDTPRAPASVPYVKNDTVWVVSIGATRVRIDSEPDEEDAAARELRTTPLRDCERLQLRCEGERLKTLRAGDDSLAHVEQGEWGGFVIVRGPHTEERKLWTDGAGIYQLIALAGSYFAVTEAGRVVQLVPPRPPESWSAKLVASLPGKPLVWDVTPENLLLVVGEDPFEPPPGNHRGISADDIASWGGRTPGDPQVVTAYAIDRSGSVTRIDVSRATRASAKVPATTDASRRPWWKRWLLQHF